MLLVPLAHAVEPTRASDGAWSAEVVWAVPADAVRAQLADPIAMARFSPDITSVTPLPPGRCARYRVATGNLVPLTYDMERCPTSSGWHETLVASEGLSAYEVDWSVKAEGEGARVRYEIHVQPSFPAPSFLVDRETKNSVISLFGRLYRAVTGG